MITRIPTWRMRLLDWAESVRDMPFIWGQTDCATLTRAALTACFGQDVAPDVPTYHSEAEARAVYLAHGSVGEILKRLGASQTTLPLARMGDVIAIAEPEEPLTGTALGIWCERFIVMSGRGGVFWAAPEAVSEKDPDVYSLWAVKGLEAVRVR